MSGDASFEAIAARALGKDNLLLGLRWRRRWRLAVVLAWSRRTWRALSAPVASATPFRMSLLCKGLQLLPLVGSEDFTNAEEHAGIGLLEISASLGDGIDLAKDLLFVELVGFEHRAQLDFLFLKCGVQVDQLEAILLKDVVHLLLLIVGDADLLRDLRLIPPAAVLAAAEGVLHWTAWRASARTAGPSGAIVLGEVGTMPVLSKGWRGS